MMIDMQIDKILYKRKLFDNGLILGKRKHIFDLTMSKLPCKAKDKDGKRLLSRITPQRENLVVYVPSDFLEVDFIFKVICRENQRYPVKEITYKVLRKGLNFISVDVLSEVEVIKKKKNRVFWQTVKIDETDIENKWFVTSAEKGRQQQEQAERFHNQEKLELDTSKNMVEFDGKIYQKKTAYCFIYDALGKQKQGSYFRKVTPDLIFDESFIIGGKEYNILTGLPVDFIVKQTVKIAPRYKEIKA